MKQGEARDPHALSLEDLRWLAASAYEIGEVTTLADLAHRCESLLASFSEIERDGLYLYDFTEEPPRLRLLYTRGFTEEERRLAEDTAPDRHPGWVVRTGQELWVPDTLREAPDSPSKDSPRRVSMRSRLWLPIAKDGEVFGAFGFASSVPNAFDERDRTNLRFVVELASMAYRRLRSEYLSERARARAREAEDRAAQLKFASLLALVPDAVVALREDGNVVYWNRGAELLLGHSAGEVLDRSITRLLPERLRSRAEDRLTSTLDALFDGSLEQTLELDVVDASGRELPVEVRVSRVVEPHQTLAIAVLRDLRERRRAAEEQARAAAETRRFSAALLEMHRSAALDPTGFLDGVAHEVAAVLEAPRVCVWRSASSALEELATFDARGSDQDALAPRLDAATFPVYFAALETQGVLAVDDVGAAPALREFEGPLRSSGIASVLDVASSALSSLRSVLLRVSSTTPRPWRSAEVAFVRDVVALVAQAMERAERLRLEARQAAIRRAIPDLIFGVSLDGHIESVGATEQHPDLLVPAELIPLRTVQDLFEPTLAARLLDAVHEAVRTGEVRTVEYDLEVNGARQWFLARMARLSPSEATVIVTNVSEARERLLSLQREQARLATVLSTTSAVLYSLALPSWEVEYITASAVEVLGWSLEEQHAPGFWRATVHPDDLGHIDAHNEEFLRTGVKVREYRQRHKNGEWRWLHDEIRVLRGADGQPIQATGAFFDITARKADEDALRELNVALERRTLRERALLELAIQLGQATSREEMGQVLLDHLRPHLDLVAISFEGMGEAVPSQPNQLEAPAQGLPASPRAPTAVAHALRVAASVTTLQHPAGAFPDWVALGDRHGATAFATLALLGPDRDRPLGVLQLSLATRSELTSDTLGWLEQIAASVTAQLVRLDAQAARDALLASLEARVDERTRDLRVSEERFAELFVRAPQGLLIVDGAGQVVRANESANDLFGYDQLEGMPLETLLTAEHRDGHGGLVKDYVEGRASPNAMRGRVVPALRRDGSQLFLQIRLVPLHRDGAARVLAGIVDVTEREVASAAIARSLVEKETLLREIHHRVKNNLQVISGLLTLQGDQIDSPDAQAKLAESVFRVRSMALVHEQLYGVESLARVDLADYTRSLSATLQQAMAPQAKIDVHAEPIEVSLDVAVPYGLILNELVTNALKYGLIKTETHSSSGSDVRIELRADASGQTLVVSDRGPGLPAGFDPARSKSLGLRLVRMLTRQLRGTLGITGDSGARFSFNWSRRD